MSQLCFRSKASNGYDAAFMEACRSELTVTADLLSSCEIWVIDGAIGPIACAALSATDQLDWGEVGLFFVDPDAQGQGAERRLWERLKERAEDLGLHALTLDADPSAVPFYERMGFQVTKTTPSESIPGRFLPVMTQILQ